MNIAEMKYLNIEQGDNIVAFDGKNIIIELPIENLINCVHCSPEHDYLKIIYSDKFAEYIVNNLFNDDFGYGDQPEFFDKFEMLAVNAYEDAEDFVTDIENTNKKR